MFSTLTTVLIMLNLSPKECAAVLIKGQRPGDKTTTLKSKKKKSNGKKFNATQTENLLKKYIIV